jgi:hypothetical protein
MNRPAFLMRPIRLLISIGAASVLRVEVGLVARGGTPRASMQSFGQRTNYATLPWIGITLAPASIESRLIRPILHNALTL